MEELIPLVSPVNNGLFSMKEYCASSRIFSITANTGLRLLSLKGDYHRAAIFLEGNIGYALVFGSATFAVSNLPNISQKKLYDNIKCFPKDSLMLYHKGTDVYIYNNQPDNNAMLSIKVVMLSGQYPTFDNKITELDGSYIPFDVV